jgi:hypothetical protein
MQASKHILEFRHPRTIKEVENTLLKFRGDPTQFPSPVDDGIMAHLGIDSYVIETPILIEKDSHILLYMIDDFKRQYKGELYLVCHLGHWPLNHVNLRVPSYKEMMRRAIAAGVDFLDVKLTMLCINDEE